MSKKLQKSQKRVKICQNCRKRVKQALKMSKNHGKNRQKSQENVKKP